MNSKLLEQEAEWVASNVTKAFTELPVDPFGLADSHNIVVQAKPSSSSGVSGYLIRVGDQFGIQYATHIKVEGFKRFTVAHELGHYFLPGHPEHLFPNGEGIHHSMSGFISSDKFERQADFFAAALLMPRDLFLGALRRAGDGFEGIETLAETCVTSITATAIRYTKFAEDPVAVVVSSGNQVDYCFMSEALRDLPRIEWLKKGTVLPASATAKFNTNFENIEEARRVEGYTWLNEWFEGAPEVEMKEDVVGLGSYGRTLTVLHTSEALAEDVEEEDDDYRFSPYRM
ncbi:ImmA/IrrE family metallo-endopeptidase [Gimesia benthica]|uniref:ImmA/IrrE family metallo-endopeptidase n=1 Tax=Gimesia benthica TaxID=2608982 RepID=A0A6I6AHD4_9PLAN|nr:ImmA/IrrE family metallo-endopeptidase [Gimesia benthica]QGQ25807.1 ImmA/IrrE family metallo-endopeptidase [Gimesia benthica]